MAMIDTLKNIKFMTMKNKNVIYTCITGRYDPLIEIPYKEEGFDYICFTDDPTLKSNTWNIRLISDELNGLSNVKKQRHIKICAHRFLSEYELSIWVDGNIPVLGNMMELIEEYHNHPYMSTFRHPYNRCIYQEALGCASVNKDNPIVMFKQVFEYMREGYPKNNGLVETKMIIRNHNNLECIELMEAWWEQLSEKSHRDQLSFNYVLWKQKKEINMIDESLVDKKYIKIVCGHKH